MKSRTGHVCNILAVVALLAALPTCAQTPPCAAEEVRQPEQITVPPDEITDEEVQRPEQKVTAPPDKITLEQVLDNMEAARKKLTTFKANVVKAKRTEVLKKVENAAGAIQFKMPRLLRMELKSVPKGEETITTVSYTHLTLPTN